ncbi:transcriptional adapter 2-alpha [Fistulifera solaris]|uniref:Transcriptional adapter 2-alpha n=1 Tax=Fistulifera solaris TaxID=1519565 RepID=A0A1Z5JPL8_FISSO|nr:transcriptional adapter 2-alpha [Fistulifera solaris]|eukprot:GAX15967.1 transcriptional adapter 2-alpha [Fistulifera solaris]
MAPKNRRTGKQTTQSSLFDEEEKKAPYDDLVLTSEKRRGVYECDYCRTDISQLPRVRCAICPDFDLCLDCLVSPPNEASHDPTHGYRVCDSTRYPLFPTSRTLLSSVSTKTSVNDEQVNEEMKEGDDSQGEDAGVSNEKEENNAPTSENENKADVTMEVEGKSDTKDDHKNAGLEDGAAPADDDGAASEIVVVQTDDRKAIWTVEEDLRLLEGIKMHGLANWVDIAEVVGGQGTTGKTPKRCMERYWDDFLGRYGKILPPYTLTVDEDAEDENEADGGEEEEVKDVKEDETTTPSRASKRRAMFMRSPSSVSSFSATNFTMGARKKFRAVPTDSLLSEDSDDFWPNPFLPEGRVIGEEVGRDSAYKAEQLYVKLISGLDSVEKVAQVRKEWEENRLLKPGGPTVLPMRPDDLVTIPGAELAGYMPRRGDFDIEWENEAEQAIADMEFLPGESEADVNLKLQVLQIYNSKLDEREQKKDFIIKRRIYDYKKKQAEDQRLPRDERDLVQRMRLFERFHTPKEHEQFLADILRAKRLRKEIAKLQMFRRMGIKDMLEAERYELDKHRHAIHLEAHQQLLKKDKSENEKKEKQEEPDSVSLWKQYRSTTDHRKGRKSLGRGRSRDEDTDAVVANSIKSESEVVDAMDVDDPTPSEADAHPAEMVVESDEKKCEQEEQMHEGNVESEMEDIKKLPSANLLSERELQLCQLAKLKPAEYLEIKRMIVQQSTAAGLVENRRKTLLLIDIERRGDVIDFMVKAGWVSPKVEAEVRSII